MACEAFVLCCQMYDERLFSKGGSVCENCHFKCCYVLPTNHCLLKNLIAFLNVLLPPEMFLMDLKLHHQRIYSVNLQTRLKLAVVGMESG